MKKQNFTKKLQEKCRRVRIVKSETGKRLGSFRSGRLKLPTAWCEEKRLSGKGVSKVTERWKSMVR